MSTDDEVNYIVDSISVENVSDASEVDFELEESEGDDEQEEFDQEYDLNLDADVDPISLALTPGTPLFLIHRSHQHSSILPRVFADISNEHSGHIGLGAVASMPRMTPTGLNRFFENVESVPIRIADPECFARCDSFGEELSQQRGGRPFVGETRKHWAYFTENQPVGQSESWIKQVLDAQREAGATLLLTPGMWTNSSSPNESLGNMRQHAVWARSNLSKGEHLAVNLTIPPAWLATPSLRERLLNEVVDMNEDIFYIRCRWPLLRQTYGQLIESSILDGYIEVSQVFEENGKSLILPNTGLTGWMSLAWGAHGFSTGMGSGERAFADTQIIRIKQRPRPAPTQRMFSSLVLHTVERGVSHRLAGSPEARPCQCQFCRTLRRMPDGQFDKALAGAHYLRQVADLTANLAMGGTVRRAAARRAVREALEFRDSNAKTVPLTGANDPKHLSVWANLLR